MSKIGTTLYLGRKRDIVIDPKQSRDIMYSGGEFRVSDSVGADFGKVQKAINEFCKDKIASIIDRGIAKLRWKKIRITLPYKRGEELFEKEVEMSVDDYLDATGFSQKLNYEIGSYEREWGINAIDPKKKVFTLFFNLNLIKYDDGPHIEHVVAHELAHVFFRDHGPKFEDALRQLDSSSSWSQSFFSGGIGSVGKTTNIIPLLVLLIVFLLGFWIYSIYTDIAEFITNQSAQF